MVAGRVDDFVWLTLRVSVARFIAAQVLLLVVDLLGHLSIRRLLNWCVVLELVDVLRCLVELHFWLERNLRTLEVALGCLLLLCVYEFLCPARFVWGIIIGLLELHLSLAHHTGAELPWLFMETFVPDSVRCVGSLDCLLA